MAGLRLRQRRIHIPAPFHRHRHSPYQYQSALLTSQPSHDHRAAASVN
jgi:hypothetical protein